MSVADKLLQVNQVKQDIKVAIETKGIPMTNVAFTEYANKILDISGGGVEVDEYFYYSKAYYTITNNAMLFPNAWQDIWERTRDDYYVNKCCNLLWGDISGDIGFPIPLYGFGNFDVQHLFLIGDLTPLEWG